MKKEIAVMLLLLLFSTMVLAHGGAEEASGGEDTVTAPVNVMDYFVPVSIGASVLLIFLSGAAVMLRDQLTGSGKKLLFLAMALVVVIPTVFMFGGTVYMNLTSFTGGEIHWHADFDIYIDGDLRDIKDAEGLANRVGTAQFHEHDDGRVHAEGIFQEREDVTLAAFFEAIGGHLTTDRIMFESDQGLVDVSNEGGKTLKVFAKRGTINQREWSMLENAPDYVISPHGTVPPGDLVVFAYTNRSEQELLQDLKEDDLLGTQDQQTTQTEHHDEEVAPHEH